MHQNIKRNSFEIFLAGLGQVVKILRNSLPELLNAIDDPAQCVHTIVKFLYTFVWYM